MLRLPLAELALPALRQRPVPEQIAVINQVFTLINADGRITVYEYCLSRLVYQALTESQKPKSGWRVDRSRIAHNPGAVALLLAVVAQSGNDDPPAAARAFAAGMARAVPGASIDYTPPAGVTTLETVWPGTGGPAAGRNPAARRRAGCRHRRRRRRHPHRA